MKVRILFILVLIVLAFGFVFLLSSSPEKVLSGIKVAPSDLGLYAESITLAKDTPPESNRCYGGVVPHHLVAGFMIADFFKRISSQKPKTIFIVGPNHYELGEGKVLTTDQDWETIEGILKADSEIISELIIDNAVSVNTEVVSKDHSIYEQLAYIRKYMPDTKVVPLLLSGRLKLEEVLKLSESLMKYTSDDTMIVVSTDFSHYLTSDQAKKNDKVTYEAIENFGIAKIMKMDSAFLDSPPSLALLLNLMMETDHKKIKLFGNTNSAEITKNDFAETTSYFSLGFY